MKTGKPKTNSNQTSLNMGFSLAAELGNVTDELVSAIIRVMFYHVGSDNRISRTDMMAELRSQGFVQSERTVRMAISELRRKFGIPIAGTGGINGGYWMLKDRQEADDYMKVQLHDPGTNLLEQESAIRKGAERWFSGDQLRLQQ